MRPLLKWAGGKSRLLPELRARLPHDLLHAIARGEVLYVEPFVGGGALFFALFGELLGAGPFRGETPSGGPPAMVSPPRPRALLLDANEELVLLYRSVRENPEEVIRRLDALTGPYLALPAEDRKAFFLKTRAAFNAERDGFDFSNPGASGPGRAACILFLNRTCFNGLFRVNSKGHFNVPFGRYRNPSFPRPDPILACSRLLQYAEIRAGDFSRCAPEAGPESFIYYDPPYRPLSPTSSFTAYQQGDFSAADQERLARFFAEAHRKGARQLLSNSDPAALNPRDDFYEKNFPGFVLERIRAPRAIPADASKRGPVSEVLIRNFG